MNLPEFERLPDAIALDLDGTLFDNESKISPRNRIALERCLDRGIPVIIATSRPARLYHRVFPDDLVDRCSYSVMNGAVTVGNPPFSGYFKEPLPEDIIREVLEIATKYYPELRITLEIDGFEFGANWTDDAETLLTRNNATPDMLLTVDEAINRSPSKIALGGIDKEILTLTDTLTECFGDALTIVPALTWVPILNITCPDVSKVSSIQKLLALSGKNLEHVIAFGDDIPDMDMLTACGYPVAMGNALPEVKSACIYYTASNDEDGVALALEKMLGDVE